jgi:serine/threonine protein kinase
MNDESLFTAALAIGDPVARAAFLDRACAGEPDRRQRIEALLAASDQSNPLDRPPVDLAQTGAHFPATPEASSSAVVGDRVGPYKLLERIGEGGMGEVWVADQLEPIKRRVALKLIKPGMDSKSVLARFEAERQALAVMDHPNIAKVLDAGQTADGRPYFVMELVKGTPITEFADARRLTPQQRLELFVPVCQAIQHAHMKGIIHRDIKPSNVLVALHDETPVPKVIDFGVAKAVGQQLTERTLYTAFGALVGTPAYMAPEQATFNQLDVDTRADVYALGVLLYELLAGSPPIEKERLKKAALDEVLRIVREEEPPRPSQRLSTTETRANIAAVRGTDPAKLSALMKGEIDWIVMKALEKDRTRRYETANGFAADVQRYLAGEPVQAVPPSLGYQLYKAYRKNVVAIWVIGLFVLFVSCSAAIALGLAWIARRAEREALEARNSAYEERANAVAAQAKAQQANQQLERVADLQRRTRYAAEMNLLQAAYTAGNMSEVGRLLEAQRPKPGETDVRGFEWHYWNRKLNGHTREVRNPDEQVSDTNRGGQPFNPHTYSKLSPNGSFLVLGKQESDGRITLTVRSTTDGRVIKQAEIPAGLKNGDAPTPNLSSLSISWDGSHVFVERVSRHEDKGPRLGSDRFAWELATGKVTALERRETFRDFINKRFVGFPHEATEWQADPDTTVRAEVHYRVDGGYLIGFQGYRTTGTLRPIPGSPAPKLTWYCWKRGDNKPLWKQETTGLMAGYVQFLDKGETFARVEYDEREVEVTIHQTATGKVLERYPPVSRKEGQRGFPSRVGFLLGSNEYNPHETVRLSPDGRWLAVVTSTGAVVADLHTSPTRTAMGKFGFMPSRDASLKFKVIEASLNKCIGLRDDGSELVTFGGSGDEFVVRTWTIKGDLAFEPVKPFPINSYLSPDGQLAVVTSDAELGKGLEPNAPYPLRVFSNTGDLLFEAPFTPNNVGSRGFAFTTRSSRHLVGVPGQRWDFWNQRPAIKNPTESAPVIVWDLTAKKEVARSKPEPDLSVLAVDVDDDNGRLAVAYVPIPKMIGPGGIGGGRGGFGSGGPGGGWGRRGPPPAPISAIKVYSFPAMQWLHDLPLPKEPPMGGLRFARNTGEWVVPVDMKTGRNARWDARTGEFRGVAQHNTADTLAPDPVQAEATATGVKYVIRDKSGAPASGTAVIATRTDRGSIARARLSPDGTRLLILSEPPKLYDVTTGRELLSLQREEERGSDRQYANPLQDGFWSADGTQFWYAVDSKGKLVGFDARPLPEKKP